MNPAIPLLDAAREVEDVLSDLGLKAVIIGGLAIFRWGEPRATRDVDFTVLCPFGEENSKTDAILNRLRGRIENARVVEPQLGGDVGQHVRIIRTGDVEHAPIDQGDLAAAIQYVVPRVARLFVDGLHL